MTLLPIPPLVVLQTMMVPGHNRHGVARWALSPAFVNREGLGAQFVRDGRVVAEQRSVAQQPVLQDHDERIAVLEGMTPSVGDLRAETAARKDADHLAQAAIADEQVGRLTGQQILATELAAAKARIAVLEAKPLPTFQQERAAVMTTAVLVGATADLTVTWPVAFPDTNYRVLPSTLAAVLLGNATVTVKTQTRTGCVLTVKAVGLALAAGQALDVIAYRFTA